MWRCGKIRSCIKMIFRGSIWGDIDSSKEMLEYSIQSFQHYFGWDHKYVVATDKPHKLADIEGIRILPFTSEDLFGVDSHTTWRKWAPMARLDITQDEIYVDADVFMVNNPIEIHRFLADERFGFGILGEHDPQPWQHGVMQDVAFPETPFVNAGFFVQKSGYSISEELISQYRWWLENIPVKERQKHDEQGAIAIALTEAYKNGQVHVFTKERFKLIGVPEVDSFDNLDGLELIHATYPTHPAFYKFKDELRIN